jgi:hypothetical protein
MDKQVACSLQPVTVNTDGTYSPDFLDTDLYYLSIGNEDQPATSGTFDADISGHGVTGLAYNISATALATALNVGFTAAGFPTCVATLLSTGIYELQGTTNGAITDGALTLDVTKLFPACDYQVVYENLGGVSSKYELLVVIRQSPMVYSHPTTLLPATGVSVSTVQAGTSTADQIKSVDFAVTPTYGGTFSVGATIPDWGNTKTIDAMTVANPTIAHTTTAHGYSTGDSIYVTGSNSTPNVDGVSIVTVTDSTHFSIPVNVTIAGTAGTSTKMVSGQCGIAKPTFSADEFAFMLTNHPLLFYRNTTSSDTISVKKNGQSFLVSFIGVLGRSALPTLAATNIDLIGATGVSGVINYNTISLFKYSLTQAEEFSLPLTIQRRRADGEVRTVFGPVPTSIYKDNLDPMTLSPVTIPTFLDMLDAAAASLPDHYIAGEVWLNGSVMSFGAP